MFRTVSWLSQNVLRNTRKEVSIASRWCSTGPSTAEEIEKDLPPAPTSPLAVPEKCPVEAYNEWDPLEELFVGRPDGALIPRMRPEIKAGVRPQLWGWLEENALKPFDPQTVAAAVKEVDELQRVLELEGCTVRRPELIEWSKRGTMTTPDFSEPGFAMACPRDCLVVVGNEIIESTSSWRSRYFDTRPWKKQLNEYFKQGAKWTLAPKPTMTDELYDPDYPYEDMKARDQLAAKGRYQLTESEPVFDGADIFRCGRDIFVQLSVVTNWGGIEWLRRHLAPEYRVHCLNLVDGGAMHIDASFVPLRPGLILANPDRPCIQVDFFRKNGWEIIYAPRPETTESNMYASSWLSINVLSLDEERVLCYKYEKVMVDILKKYGFKPIGVDLTNAFTLGGAFHCWTLDVRRKGTLKSYFDKF